MALLPRPLQHGFLRVARGYLQHLGRSEAARDFVIWPLATRVLGREFATEVRLRNGVTMLGTMQDILTRYILFFGADVDYIWEPATSRLASHIASAKLLSIVAGAHVGYHALLCAVAARAAGGQVITFEPNRELFGILSTNIRLNSLGNVRAERLALGSSVGSRKMTVDNIRSALLSDVDATSTPLMTHEVQVTSLDAYAGQRALADVDFMLLDLEGAEPDVLEGCRARILRQKVLPDLIVEVSPRILARSQASPAAMRHTLTELGYRCCYAILGDEQCPQPNRRAAEQPVRLVSWTAEAERHLASLRWYNILATTVDPRQLVGDLPLEIGATDW